MGHTGGAHGAGWCGAVWVEDERVLWLAPSPPGSPPRLPRLRGPRPASCPGCDGEGAPQRRCPRAAGTEVGDGSEGRRGARGSRSTEPGPRAGPTGTEGRQCEGRSMARVQRGSVPTTADGEAAGPCPPAPHTSRPSDTLEGQLPPAGCQNPQETQRWFPGPHCGQGQLRRPTSIHSRPVGTARRDLCRHLAHR